MKMPNQKKLQAECDYWNQRVKVGDMVAVHLDNGAIFTTKTRSKASVLQGHSAVIWLENISGCYLLSRCFSIP